MNKLLAVHVSNRQYNVMREAAQSHGVSLARMLQISQVTVGGIFRRGYMFYNKKSGMFQLTKTGVEVMKQYTFTEVDRKDANRSLSQFIPGYEGFNRPLKTKKAVA